MFLLADLIKIDFWFEIYIIHVIKYVASSIIIF